jgi:hypothetical protein
MKFFYGEVLLTPRPAPKLEDHPLSAVRDCLFNVFAATLHNRRPFLHPQPEDAPCRGDRDPLNTVICINTTLFLQSNSSLEASISRRPFGPEFTTWQSTVCRLEDVKVSGRCYSFNICRHKKPSVCCHRHGRGHSSRQWTPMCLYLSHSCLSSDQIATCPWTFAACRYRQNIRPNAAARYAYS